MSDNAQLARTGSAAGAIVFGTTVITGWWLLAVAASIIAIGAGGQMGSRLAAVWTVTFALLMLQTVMYHLERARKITPRIARQLDALHVAILMPTYNEDPGYLRLGLQSFIDQTRRPDSVHVVDDGSTNTDYADVRAWWHAAAAAAGIATTWQRVDNGGKRHAQAHGVRMSPGADMYVTVDSDSCLAPNAIEQVLVPFARPKVQSVAGIVIVTNHRANLLARITDLWFVTGQLVDSSALSAMGSVLVNSGPLAVYRAEVIRDNLDSYLNETFHRHAGEGRAPAAHVPAVDARLHDPLDLAHAVPAVEPVGVLGAPAALVPGGAVHHGPGVAARGRAGRVWELPAGELPDRAVPARLGAGPALSGADPQ